ncbi:MAG: hypothetical protein VXX85_03780 [Candidatus Margulisiibacteriota bacterium]|nr:hypothetical protein [Candidatus Margulisiibacteriota bacterium]
MEIPTLKRTRSQTKTYDASKRARTALKQMPFSTSVTTLNAEPSQSIDELKTKYNSVSHTIHPLHDYFKTTTTLGSTIATELNGKITLNDIPCTRRCFELRDVDEYGNTPMHLLALNASFDTMQSVFTYFKETLNAENKAIFFEKNQKNSDGLTAYDIARQRVRTSHEKEVALQFFKFNVADEFPLSIFGEELPPSRQLRELMDCTATTTAAKSRTITISGFKISLPTINESKQGITARLDTSKVRKPRSFNSSLDCFSHPSIFGITQLKNATDIDGDHLPADCCWSEKTLLKLNIQQLTQGLCCITPLNKETQTIATFKESIHDLLILIIIIYDFNELKHPLVSEDQYEFLNQIVDNAHNDDEMPHIMPDYKYRNDIIYAELIRILSNLDILIGDAINTFKKKQSMSTSLETQLRTYWKTALKEHFNSTIYEKDFMTYLQDYSKFQSTHTGENDDTSYQQDMLNYFITLGSRTIGIDVIYQIILAFSGIDGEIKPVKQLTDQLAIMARLSNDAQSGLKELFAPISKLTVAEQETIWTPSFLTKSIQTIRDQLQAYTAVLPATFPIILAEKGNNSIQFGHYSLILLYSRLLEQVENDLPELRRIFESNDDQRKAIYAIINWTIGQQNSILTWSQSISQARYKKIGFH